MLASRLGMHACRRSGAAYERGMNFILSILCATGGREKREAAFAAGRGIGRVWLRARAARKRCVPDRAGPELEGNRKSSHEEMGGAPPRQIFEPPG